MEQYFKKSLYLFLCSLLGMLLFLVLHQVAVFFYLILAGGGFQPFMTEASSLTFLGIEYFTLILTLILGAWYGIWVGLYWYQVVYEEGSSRGLVDHVTMNYWPKKASRYDLSGKIEIAKKHLETGMWELEDAAKTIPAAVPPKPIKKRVVRKRAPKKINTSI